MSLIIGRRSNATTVFPAPPVRASAKRSRRVGTLVFRGPRRRCMSNGELPGVPTLRAGGDFFFPSRPRDLHNIHTLPKETAVCLVRPRWPVRPGLTYTRSVRRFLNEPRRSPRARIVRTTRRVPRFNVIDPLITQSRFLRRRSFIRATGVFTKFHRKTSRVG